MEEQLREQSDKLSEVLADREQLSEEIKRLRREIAQAKQEAQKQPDPHDSNEAETRD